MSALGVLFSRGITALGGPQAAAVFVVGGIAVGAIGGGAIGAGVLGGKHGGSASTGSVPIYPCPNQGPALLTVAGGQQLLVTGRLADGSWLRIHLPEPGRSEGWIQATPLTVSGSIDSLPVATCGAEALIAAPAVIAMPSLTAIVNASPTAVPTAAPTPTSTPTSAPTATPTAAPTATPNAAPTLTKLLVSTKTISYDTGAYCPTAIKKVTFSVTASDTSGIAGVALFWRAPGSAMYAQAPMTMSGGTATGGTWQVTLDTTVNPITKAGSLAFYAVGTDTGGLTGRVPASGSSAITVAVCLNTGPSITQVASSGGSTLYWDPLSVGGCQTATNITAVVNDIDGVGSVTLFFRRPGSSTYSSKPMDNTTIPGKWYANLDTLGDKISIPAPPTGTLSWYIKAVDKKNAASQTTAASMTIRRCDSPAQFDGVLPVSSTYSCSSATITVHTFANDPDQPENGLKVVFVWTLSNPRTRPTPISGQMTSNSESGNDYFGTTAAFDGKTFYYASLSVYAVTTDKYGGTTQTQTYTYTMACQ